jgi:hypothetical protein
VLSKLQSEISVLNPVETSGFGGRTESTQVIASRIEDWKEL